MTSDQEKNLEKLAEAVERGYGSKSGIFWRGFLWGLGRGIGNLIGFLILLAILYYLFKLTGLDQIFREIFRNVQNFLDTLQRLPR